MVDHREHVSDEDTGRTAADIWSVRVAALVSAVAVAVANISGISIGDDGVGYQAIADSLVSGHGLGYFLEDPVTVWPPLWPAAMALVARITPLGTVGAAVVLNCVVAALTVLVANHLLRLVLTDRRLVLTGTVVIAIGPATIGLGHVLMTDMVFTLLVMTWMIVLLRATGRTSPGAPEGDSLPGLVLAALLAWAGFGLRYVGLTLIAFGGLWLLCTTGRSMLIRIRNAALYGVVASVVPLAWMARNHSIDGTFTGERHTSARGLLQNLFDIAATTGRFLVPGVMNEATKLWAPIGVVGVITAAVITWWLLAGPDGSTSAKLRHAWAIVSTPIGLITTWTVLYLTYMLYVRTTTALNVLDLRLLFPAYFPMVIMGLTLADRSIGNAAGRGWIRTAVTSWAVINVGAGLIAMVAFGTGHPFFTGDYASDTFVAVRENPALDALPEDCETYSNLPNALYPAVEPVGWSPQRTALESIDPVDDLERISSRSADHEVCMVWIDERPAYGHLWPLEELHRRLSLQTLADDGPVTVYSVRPAADD